MFGAGYAADALLVVDEHELAAAGFDDPRAASEQSEDCGRHRGQSGDVDLEPCYL